MSKIICAGAIDGAIGWVAKAEAKLDEAIKLKGEDAAVGFPNTAYYLPVGEGGERNGRKTIPLGGHVGPRPLQFEGRGTAPAPGRG